MQKNQKLPYFPLLFCFFLFLGGFYLGHRNEGLPVLRAEHEITTVSGREMEISPPLETGTPATRALPRSDGRINPNTATLEELKTLPGIGEVLAQRILDYRTQNGPFQNPEDLMKVTGIGEKTYAALRDLIDLGGTE